MSYGYESLITPLQTLALYNAVANGGRMVKPRFEKEIRKNGKTVKTFTTEVLVEQIVKKETIAKAREMLEGVVQNGSGKGLNITAFKVGGKTGTAQIAKTGAKRGSGKTAYGEVGNRDYQASFVGYFPADKPLYTCIVIINSPSNGIYYGGLVAGPVFKEIAEKVYSSSVDFLEPVNHKQNLLTKAPPGLKSKNDEMMIAYKALKIPFETKGADDEYVSNTEDSTAILFQPSNIKNLLDKGIVPNLNGLSAKDALFLLENSGFHVKLHGIGSVRKQSIEAGQRFNKGDKITLILS